MVSLQVFPTTWGFENQGFGRGCDSSSLAKKQSPNLNSIDAFASAQGFSSHPAFFENAKQLQSTPDQEIQLPGYKTYLIARLDVRTNVLAKVSHKNIDSIDAFASAQGFSDLLFSGGAFSLVFACFVLVEVAR